MCALRNVIVPSISERIQQNSLPCYAGPKVLPIATPNQFLQYYKKTIIFPYSYDIMMIFENIQGTGYYAFLTFYENFQWSLPITFDIRVFTAPVPYFYENIEAANSILRPKCLQLLKQRYVYIHFAFI